MKKYYDAMYKAFNYYYNLVYCNKNMVSRSIKHQWREALYAELGGVLDVACLDNEVNGGDEFDCLLNLRGYLYIVARTYFLAD